MIFEEGTSVQFSSVQLLSCVWLFATPWTAACQASLSIPNSWSLLNLMSIESVMPSNHFFLCHPLLILPSIFPRFRVFSNKLALCINQVVKVLEFELQHQSFPASGSFPVNQFFASGGQSIWVSASASVLPMNTQDWSPLGWTGWTSLQSKGLSGLFSNTAAQKHQFFSP